MSICRRVRGALGAFQGVRAAKTVPNPHLCKVSIVAERMGWGERGGVGGTPMQNISVVRRRTRPTCT